MKVKQKQANSRMCAICGMDNPFGVKAPFYVLEDNRVATLFRYREEHQSYPGRVHGGLITAMLDELGMRAYWALEPESLAVTISLETRYRKPVPYEVPLKGCGIILSSNSHFIKSQASIMDMNGNILAQAEMRYLKLPTQRITDANYHEEMCYHIRDDVLEIEI